MKVLRLAVIGLTALGLSNVIAGDELPEPSRERIELAKRVYRDRILYGLKQRSGPPRAFAEMLVDPLINEAMAEELHRWSVRWMEAEFDAAPDRSGRVAAAEAHRDRMKSVELGTMVRKELANHPMVKELDKRKIPVVDMDIDEFIKGHPDLPETTRRYPEVTHYFRLEAEQWLAKEKAGR